MRKLRFSSVGIEHPGERDRMAGAESAVYLQLFNARDSVERVPLSEDELVKLIANAANALQILRTPRRQA